MRKILIMNAKGGSGKTTVATNLAGYFAMKGASVALADFDPQGSSIDWLRQRRGNLPKIIGLETFSIMMLLKFFLYSKKKLLIILILLICLGREIL